MAFEIREHPLMFYVTFVLPATLLLLTLLAGANVLHIILCALWFGVAFLMLYLPVESDNGGI